MVGMRNPMWKTDSYFNQIIDIAYAFQKSKVLFTAIELGLFEAFGNSKLTAAELSDKLNTDAHSTDRLLNTLVSMGLIEKEGAIYSNSEASRQHLLAESPEYIGSLMHVHNLWDSWTDLTECIKLGKPRNFKTVNQKDDNWIEAYLMSMQWKAVHEAPEVIKFINVHGVKNFLDLGCGSACYAIELAQQNPLLKGFVYDYPSVIKQSERYIKEAGLNDRIKTLSGDFTVDSFGKDYDLILISYVLNEYSIWDNIKLMQKVYDALNKNGRVVIHQQIISDDRTYPHLATMEGLNMIVNTPDGDCFTETDVWIMLKESWFQEIEKYNTEFGTSLIVARKTTTF